MADIVDLKDYINIRFAELRLYCDSRFDAIEKAAGREITITYNAMQKLNEVREQLAAQLTQFNSQIVLYLPVREYSARHEQLLADVRRVESIFANYTQIAQHKVVETDIRVLLEWKANMAGRLWAIGICLAILQVAIAIIRHLTDT